MTDAFETVVLEKQDGVAWVTLDRPSVHNAMNLAMRDELWSVIEAVDGQDAVRCFEERGDSIDLVLMDVVMPKMGGRDAALVMEKINSEVKIVFTTGYSDDSLHTQFIREGNLPLIPKPYGTDLLRAQIRSVLDGDIGHLESSRIAAS